MPIRGSLRLLHCSRPGIPNHGRLIVGSVEALGVVRALTDPDELKSEAICLVAADVFDFTPANGHNLGVAKVESGDLHLFTFDGVPDCLPGKANFLADLQGFFTYELVEGSRLGGEFMDLGVKLGKAKAFSVHVAGHLDCGCRWRCLKWIVGKVVLVVDEVRKLLRDAWYVMMRSGEKVK